MILNSLFQYWVILVLIYNFVICSLVRMSCEECMKKDKKMRIIKSDYDF